MSEAIPASIGTPFLQSVFSLEQRAHKPTTVSVPHRQEKSTTPVT